MICRLRLLVVASWWLGAMASEDKKVKRLDKLNYVKCV